MPNSILVVDDERDFTDLTAYHLRHKGYEVTVAHDGERALDEARRRLPDLILLDLMLPEIDGFTVCELLRHHAPTRAIPILLLTAQTGQLTRFHALAVGADQFLTKPIRLAELARRVEEALRLRGTLCPPRGAGASALPPGRP